MGPITLPTDTGVATAITPSRARLGVLFVHGIGEQKEGETLVACAEPILGWIKRWIVGHGTGPGDGVRVMDSVLFPFKRIERAPAHARVDIVITPPGAAIAKQQAWLFAEAWWGEQVQAPPVLGLLGWLVSRGPWVVLLHVLESLRRFTRPRSSHAPGGLAAALGRTGRRVAAWPIGLLVWFVVTAVLQLSLLREP